MDDFRHKKNNHIVIQRPFSCYRSQQGKLRAYHCQKENSNWKKQMIKASAALTSYASLALTRLCHRPQEIHPSSQRTRPGQTRDKLNFATELWQTTPTHPRPTLILASSSRSMQARYAKDFRWTSVLTAKHHPKILKLINSCPGLIWFRLK